MYIIVFVYSPLKLGVCMIRSPWCTDCSAQTCTHDYFCKPTFIRETATDQSNVCQYLLQCLGCCWPIILCAALARSHCLFSRFHIFVGCLPAFIMYHVFCVRECLVAINQWLLGSV